MKQRPPSHPINQIPSLVAIDIICTNALDTASMDYNEATVIFLYLGYSDLRIISTLARGAEQSLLIAHEAHGLANGNEGGKYVRADIGIVDICN